MNEDRNTIWASPAAVEYLQSAAMVMADAYDEQQRRDLEEVRYQKRMSFWRWFMEDGRWKIHAFTLAVFLSGYICGLLVNA